MSKPRTTRQLIEDIHGPMWDGMGADLRKAVIRQAEHRHENQRQFEAVMRELHTIKSCVMKLAVKKRQRRR